MRLTTVWGPVSRWGEFRRRQLQALERSNRLDRGPLGDEPGAAPAEHPLSRYGAVGQPLNRHSPFYLGFFGATGAMLAFGLWTTLGRLATTLSILLVAFFLALALDPVVERLMRHRVRRSAAVAAVFGGLVVVIGAIGWLVLPTAITQGSSLAQAAPQYVVDLLDARWVHELDSRYNVIGRLQTELLQKLGDQGFIEGLVGGLLGAGRAVLSGTFQILTVLVLTL